LHSKLLIVAFFLAIAYNHHQLVFVIQTILSSFETAVAVMTCSWQQLLLKMEWSFVDRLLFVFLRLIISFSSLGFPSFL